jgi:flagellar assembly protein FliH
MNSSSDPIQTASYAPLEYREADEPLDAVPSPQPSPEAAEAKPCSAELKIDAAELLAARIEEERRTVSVQLRQEAEREIQRARADVARSIEQFAQQRDEYFKQAEAEVVSLALAIAHRLIHREVQIDRRLVAGLVSHELAQFNAATDVRLFVSPETLSFWREAALAMPHSPEVAADPALASGEARIETSLGSTTVGLENELKEIERGFFDLLSHRPASAESRPVRVQ